MAIVQVTFDWDDRHGECYDCGLPAAYEAPDIYGPNSTATRVERLFCSVCAAMHASDGQQIVYLFAEHESACRDHGHEGEC